MDVALRLLTAGIAASRSSIRSAGLPWFHQKKTIVFYSLGFPPIFSIFAFAISEGRCGVDLLRDLSAAEDFFNPQSAVVITIASFLLAIPARSRGRLVRADVDGSHVEEV